MDIKITFQDGRWTTDPNPALALPGTKIRWVVRAPQSQHPRLRWIIDFRNRSPFAPESSKFTIETKTTDLGNADNWPPSALAARLEQLGLAEELADHRGATPPVQADHPGHYKYDLHLENPETGEKVGDDDPYLYVIRPLTIWI